MFGIDIIIIILHRFDKMITRLIVVFLMEPVFTHEPLKIGDFRVFLKSFIQQCFPRFPLFIGKMLLYDLGILLRCLETFVASDGRGYQQEQTT